MRILFDFEPFGNEQIDAHLTDMLLTFKAEAKRAYQELQLEKPEDITLIITAKPGEFSVACIAEDEIISKSIQEGLYKSINFERAILLAAQKDLN